MLTMPVNIGIYNVSLLETILGKREMKASAVIQFDQPGISLFGKTYSLHYVVQEAMNRYV
jgi:hypothetical protein